MQIVKEKSTRDSYHDMKKAIMARLINNREHKSNVSSQTNNPISAVSHNSSCSSLTAMGRSSVFPLLNAAMIQFQSGLLTGKICGCDFGENCTHLTENIKSKRNQTWNVKDISGSTTATSSVATNSLLTNQINKPTLLNNVVCGTPTLETVFESYDGENDENSNYDLKKYKKTHNEESKNNSIHHSERETKTFVNTFKSDIQYENNRPKTKIKKLNFFEYENNQIGMDSKNKLQESRDYLKNSEKINAEMKEHDMEAKK
ncbi:hypothetical protein HELRODRAFT_176146 [Helobdella robusta]|uniref:Uncharacterized protein n=1 Tax=Helobdella robusta TaxID=6412 RepID=T1FA74_HELRO|nr:hypothetical protein HELRODRAFT_176146 [Helobdella robusta]ESO00282.1 hypothetical protein HELRODRAFT_176146 [Helobdella robusta]